MDKMFIIILVTVIIIGFSASTYIFSQVDVSIELDDITDNLSGKKAQVLEEIDRCMSQNTVAGGAVTLNSFERNLLSSVIKQVADANDVESLEKISEQIYTMTSCKPE